MEENKKNSILVVDDELLNLKMLRNILHDEYTVYTAKDGESGLIMADEVKPDLILLDIIMRGMDGYEVFAELKRKDNTRHIPVIFITGLDSKAQEEKGLALNAADYIGKPFSSGIVKLRVKHQIQIINQIRTIERLSDLDQLTQIPNRRSLDRQLMSEWSRAVREQLPLSLLMIDVDKFKNYNDTYGHVQGDNVLQSVAAAISGVLSRGADFAARFGGEEFCVLLPGVNKEGALTVAEQVCAAVRSLNIQCCDDMSAHVTISVGVYSLIPVLDDNIPDFISKADKALYAAKEAGRNCVREYTED